MKGRLCHGIENVNDVLQGEIIANNSVTCMESFGLSKSLNKSHRVLFSEPSVLCLQLNVTFDLLENTGCLKVLMHMSQTGMFV